MQQSTQGKCSRKVFKERELMPRVGQQSISTACCQKVMRSKAVSAPFRVVEPPGWLPWRAVPMLWLPVLLHKVGVNTEQGAT